MDEQRFDTLARSIGALRTRRSVLTALAAAAVAAAPGLGGREAAAALKRGGAKCSSGSQCASGACIQYDVCKKHGRLTGKCRCGCTTDDDCPSGKTCRNGACFRDCPTPTDCTGGQNFVTCNREGTCYCFSTDLGPSCVTLQVLCTENPCDTSEDCPQGQVCMTYAPCCCGCEKFCTNPCGLGGNTPTILTA